MSMGISNRSELYPLKSASPIKSLISSATWMNVGLFDTLSGVMPWIAIDSSEIGIPGLTSISFSIGSSPPFGYLMRAICTILSFITLSPVDSISKNTKSLSKLNFMSCICRCRFICIYYLRSIVNEYETNYIDVCTNI